MIESRIFYHDFHIQIVMESTKIIERLFLVKKVKTSFYHDLMIYTKRDASLTSEASDRRPFECKSSKSDRKTLLFLQDVFFFNFRGFQTSPYLLMWFCGECQKSHLEIRSSYGSRDSFFDFWETRSILIEDFQNKNRI